MFIFPFIQSVGNYILSNFYNLYTFIIPVTEISPKNSLVMKVGEFSWLTKIFDYYEKVRLEEQGKFI